MDPTGLFDHLSGTETASSQAKAGPSKLPHETFDANLSTEADAKAARKEARRSEREARKKRDRSGDVGAMQEVPPSDEAALAHPSHGVRENEQATTSNGGQASPRKKKQRVVNGASLAGSTGANPLTMETAPVLTDEFVAEASRNLPAERPAGGAAQVAKVVTASDAQHADTSAPDDAKQSVTDGSTAAAAAAAAAEVAGGVIGTSVSGPSAGGAPGAMEIRHSVRHQVALPPAYPYVPLSSHVPPAKPAREWPFTLDPFQRTAIASIQRGESVLVSAHTSAGKTVVAEYAIAQCLKEGQRVVYTSPIKALSNQKYREMSAEFGDVGLMTGDVTINPSASCLVMTTEILRSMLYRGSEIMREVAWVVFDEIHYMRDKERGVVWEETIILLPRKVRYVFLSATIPNAMQFASWIAHTHQQPCHVVYTDFRPTPLQHYLFPLGAEGIHLVVDEAGRFREDNFQAAMGALNSARGEDPASVDSGGKGRKGQTRKGGASKGPSDIYKIIRMIMVKNYNPVIVFAFSKRECEGLALQMAKLEFNNDDEKNMVATVFNNAITALSEEDRALPQIEHLLPLLRRGIGIHHGGLLPILKEVIEILFQEGLIKVLFATETFSIGLNMPAKTVVFTSVRKFDGTENRNLTSGEFIQMSGRAGRRGLDDRGIVIMMFDEKLEPADAKTMVKGEADRLNSAFHLGYNMILNLMRVEGISPEYMLERCFFQFQSAASVPELEGTLAAQREQLAQAVVPDEDHTEEYFTLKEQLEELQGDVKEVISHPTYALPFLQPGRLAHVRHEDLDFGWGIVIRYQKRTTPSKGGRVDASASDRPQSQWIVDVLLDCEAGSVAPTIKDVATRAQKQVKGADTAPLGLRPCPMGKKGELLVVPVLLSTVSRLSGVRLNMPPDVRSRERREQVRMTLLEVKKRFAAQASGGKGVPILDPVKDMKITDESFATLLSKIKLIEARLAESRVASLSSKEREDLRAAYEHKQELQRAVRSLEQQLDNAHSVLQLDELKCRKRVLRRLGFTSEDDVVQKKGRVACEISTGDELLLTEMIFNNVFNDLDPNQCAALLSCFVFDEKSEQQTRLKEDLAGPLRTMQETARRIAKVSIESRLQVNEDEYVASFKVELMEAVLQWCRGARFAEICKMTDVFEGSLIRVFRRLQELLRQVIQASKAIGNVELQEKFEASQKALERENSIIFSPSLYL